jgi:predicted  nucleic acid-binding Zn-ribbon protein
MIEEFMLETHFFGRIVEGLSSLILMLVAGAYSFLWYKIRKVEEDVEMNRQSMTDVSGSQTSMWNRIFGQEEDDTMSGHLVETEEQFDHIYDKLEEISTKIDDLEEQVNNVEERREREHAEVVSRVSRISAALDADEDISFVERD